MRPSFVFYIFVNAFALISCNKDKNSSTETADNVQKYYYPSGELYMEIEVMNDSIPHGLSKEYFKTGQLFQEIQYSEGLKHGLSKRYYEDGKLSLEVVYEHGKKHGVEKKYRKDGKLAYEAPYYLNQPMVGLKEYYTNGQLIDHYAELVLEEVKGENGSALIASLSRPLRVEFFVCELTSEGYLPSECPKIRTNEKGVGRIDFNSGKLANGLQSEFALGVVTIVAKVKTELGNSYLIEKKYASR
jgi:hypothetical protein